MAQGQPKGSAGPGTTSSMAEPMSWCGMRGGSAAEISCRAPCFRTVFLLYFAECLQVLTTCTSFQPSLMGETYS